MKTTHAFAELIPGDRFVWNDTLYTRLERDTAREHSLFGPGNNLAAVVSFEPETPVQFVDVNAMPIFGRDSAGGPWCVRSVI